MVEHSDLSERELQILRLVATGVGNKEIANQLSISTNTVKVHLRNIFDKIQVSSRTEAAMYAVHQGLVGEQPGKMDDNSLKADPNNSFLREYSLASVPSETELSLKSDLLRKKRRYIWGISIFTLVLLIFFVIYLIDRQNNPNSSEFGFDSTRWEQFPDLEDGREGFALVMQSNQLFAIAGTTNSGVTDLVTAYPLEDEKWEPKQPKPAPVSDIQAVTISGLIYVPGGIGPEGTVVDLLEIYNPSIDTWFTGKPLPEPRCRYSLVALEGMVFLFGGWDGNEFQDNAYMYNPAEDRWDQLAPMISPRAWTGAAISGGQIYLFGGVNDDGISDQIEVFTPPNTNEPLGKWTQVNPLPKKRYAFGATALADLVFIVGGRGEDETALPNWIYYPEIVEWRSFPSPIPDGVIHQGVTGVGTHLYIAGGQIDNEIQNLVYSYQAFFTASLPIVR